MVEPPGGSRLTARAAVPAGNLFFWTTLAPLAEMRPSELGAAPPLAESAGTAHSSRARSDARLTPRKGLVTTLRPSPLMLATNEAGVTVPSALAGAVDASTTTMGGCAGPGLASNSIRLNAATLASAEKPRQNDSRPHQPVSAASAARCVAAAPMRASMRFHTSAGGVSG